MALRPITILLAALAAGFCAITAAPAQEPQDTRPLPVTTEDGVTLPLAEANVTGDQLYAVWPAEARRLGIEGRATLQCVIDTNGRARDCAVQGEYPEGMGFGLAAAQLTPLVTAQPATDRDGVPVPFSIPIEYVFRCEERCEPLNPDTLRGRLAVRVPWASAPSVSDVLDVYPPRAQADRVSGDVTLECHFRANGSLARCRVISETPARWGFGTAALQLTGKFRMRPSGRDVADIRLLLPVRFELENEGHKVGAPELAAAPSRSAYLSAFPAQALESGVASGAVVLGCEFNENGYLTGCNAETETPTGNGFAAAALTLSSSYRFNLWSAEGLPVIGGRVLAPFEFEKPLEPLAETPRRLDRPTWAQRPTAEQMSHLYPLAAIRREIQGRATLECQIHATGAVEQCRVVEETPEGFGFGAAALETSKLFRLSPPMVDGRPVMPTGAVVNIPVLFQLR